MSRLRDQMRGFGLDEELADADADALAARDKRIAELETLLGETQVLAYLGDHHFPDLTYKRAEACVTLFDDCREALLACEARGGGR